VLGFIMKKSHTRSTHETRKKNKSMFNMSIGDRFIN